MLRGDKWKINRDLVLKKRKMLKDKVLRVEIIQLHYNMLVARHKER